MVLYHVEAFPGQYLGWRRDVDCSCQEIDTWKGTHKYADSPLSGAKTIKNIVSSAYDEICWSLASCEKEWLGCSQVAYMLLVLGLSRISCKKQPRTLEESWQGPPVKYFYYFVCQAIKYEGVMNSRRVTFQPSSSSVLTIKDLAGCYLNNRACMHVHADGKLPTNKIRVLILGCSATRSIEL